MFFLTFKSKKGYTKLMKSKKKNLFKRFCSGVLGLCFASVCFLASGCVPSLLGGDWINDLNEQLENGEITQEEYDRLFNEYSGGVELEGIKVLRRPKSYDYDGNVSDGGSNYYYQFSEDIFSNIYAVYGVVGDVFVDPDKFPPSDDKEEQNIFDVLYNLTENDNIKTLKDWYEGSASDSDNLKYFYDAIRYQIVDEEEIDEDLDGTKDYVQVTADTNLAWNWVKGYEEFNSENDSQSRYISNYITSIVNSVDGTTGVEENNKIMNNKIASSYNFAGFQNYYKDFIDSTAYQELFANDDFISTLAYMIYRIVLGLDTDVEVGFNESGEWVVEGYEGKDGKTSAQIALEDIKRIFNSAGSYVGLTQNNKQQIADYILEEVIGQEAQVYGRQNLFYEDVVNAVVEYCGKLTTVGNAGEDDEITNVGDTFIASEIIDYPSTSFFISQNEADPFEGINSHEYQSMVLMPKNVLNLTDIWLDFKYVAKNEDGSIIDDSDLFINITTYIRWWTGTELRVYARTIKVYNGVVDPGSSKTTIDFELDSNEVFGEAVKVGKFSCDAINPSLNPSGKDELTGFDYSILSGKTTARHYYQVVNSASYGGYGVLNQEKISSEQPEMSYLEIAFDVSKEVGDFTTNYDFYVGFSQLYNDDRDFSWVK